MRNQQTTRVAPYEKVDNSGITPDRVIGPAGIEIREATGSDVLGSTCQQYGGFELQSGEELPKDKWVVRMVASKDRVARLFAFSSSEQADDAQLGVIVNSRDVVTMTLISSPSRT